jgi:alpha-glucosidase
LAADAQERDGGSTLNLYRSLLTHRRSLGLGTGRLEWIDDGGTVLAFRNGGVTVVVNMGDASVPLPAGRVLVASDELPGGLLPPDTAVWLISE